MPDLPQPAIHRAMTPTEWGLLIFLSVLWGGSFFFIGVAVRELPPLSVVTLRVVIAASALLVVLQLAGHSLPRDRTAWRAFFAMSLINNVVPFCLIVWAQTQITSGLAAILNATSPLFAVVIAHFATSDERMTANRLAGVLIGLAGVAWMIGFGALGGLGTSVWAQFAMLAASVSYACSSVYGRRFGGMGVPPLATAAGSVAMAAVLMVPVALIADRPWTLPMPSTETWLAVGGLALISTAFAYVIYFRILATAGATNLILVTFLIPVSAILLGTLVLCERLTLNHFAGMAAIGIGLAAIDGRLLRRLKG